MKPEQYRPVILKTLRDLETRKVPSVESLADAIVANMGVFEEMLSLAGGVLVHTPAEAPASSLIVSPTAARTSYPPDISERLVPEPKPEELTEDEIIRMKQDALAAYKRDLPMVINAQPPGFREPLPLQRIGLKGSPGGMPLIRIEYAPSGASTEFAIITIGQAVTGKLLSPEEVIAEVTTQANSRYSSQPRSVQTNMPPRIESLEAQMAGSPSADTDPETSSADMEFWNRNARPISR